METSENFIVKRSNKMVQKVLFPLKSAICMVFVMLESIIFDFHERWWALHSLGGDFKSMGKTSNQQHVTEPFGYHCKPLDFARNEANLTTAPLEPLNRA